MAKITDKIKSFFSRKTLSMTNSKKQVEWSIRISNSALVGGLLVLIALLFVAVMALVAYTPVLDLFPGYRTAAERAHDELIQNIMRVDSLERTMSQFQQYSDNISMVMDGKTPVLRSQLNDTIQYDKTLVKPSHADSLLRSQMEGDGEYSLSHVVVPKEREGELFAAPIQGGKIVRHFSSKENYMGVTLQVAPNSPITSVGDGTVMSIISNDSGYSTVVIQHYNGFVSVYYNLLQPMVTRAQAVKSGQVLGYNSMPQVGDTENPLFEMELWSDGKAVDPEIYMVF
ncbi:MAG: M23 family metallopeptidase [Alistipes sp.]|nr:M23 family metallopeptidase [Alistipes sp.]